MPVQGPAATRWVDRPAKPKRYDIMASSVAMRNGVALQEQETRLELKRQFDNFRRDIVKYENMQTQKRERDTILCAAKAVRDNALVQLRTPELQKEEDDDRRHILVVEVRTRKSLLRLMSFEASVLTSCEGLQRLIHAEASKRYTLERNQQREIAAVIKNYGKTPWKPVLRMLGHCPFVEKGKCPFFDSGMCHGLNVSPSHHDGKAEEEEEHTWTGVIAPL